MTDEERVEFDRVVRERDDARERVRLLEREVDSFRNADWYKFRGGYIEDPSGGRWWSAALLARTEAERDELKARLARVTQELEASTDFVASTRGHRDL